MERWKVSYMYLPGNSLWGKYGSDFGCQGRSMRTIVTEAPQLALASSLSQIREIIYAVLRRTTLKRTREPSSFYGPSGFNGLPCKCGEL